MRSMKNFRRAAGATGVAIVGTGFFFTIIGVFGLGFAITGLLVFVVIAAITYFAFTGDEVDL
jgi:hypothetical protein